MPYFKKQSGNKKDTAHCNFSSSQSHQSEEEGQGVGVLPKKQEKPEQIDITKKRNRGTGQSEARRNQRPPITNKQNRKMNNTAGIEEACNEVKKQQKKTNAAPSQIPNSSSDNSSVKSQNSEKSQQQKAAPDQVRESFKLYIGNLPLQLSQAQVEKLFKKFGKLKSFKLQINSTTGKSKGFGFAEYMDIPTAIKAKNQIVSHIVNGQKISAEFCLSQ